MFIASYKNKSDASVKKFIILVVILAIGCGGIAYLGFHQGAHKAPPLALMTLGEATKGNLNSLKFDNLDLTNVSAIPSLPTLYKGTFYLPDTESVVKEKAESYFKKQAKEIKIKYDRKFFRPYNTKYRPAGCDYEVNDITLSPHVYTVTKQQDGKTIKNLHFQMNYKGIPFADVLCGEKYLSWFYCAASFVDDSKNGEMISLEGMSLKAKKLIRVKKIISAVDAVKLFSKKLSGHKKYDVSSIRMEYMSQLTDKERKQLDEGAIRDDLKEGNEYVVSPYWAIYLDATPNEEIVGYVNAQSGEVLFVNNRTQFIEE